MFAETNEIWTREIEGIRIAFIKKYFGENIPEAFGKSLKDPICVLLGTTGEDHRAEAANNLVIFIKFADADQNPTPEEIRSFIETEAYKTTFARIGLDARRTCQIVDQRFREDPFFKGHAIRAQLN